jgi:hypothetical protein
VASAIVEKFLEGSLPRLVESCADKADFIGFFATSLARIEAAVVRKV